MGQQPEKHGAETDAESRRRGTSESISEAGTDSNAGVVMLDGHFDLWTASTGLRTVARCGRAFVKSREPESQGATE